MTIITGNEYSALDYGIASTASDTFQMLGDLVTGNQPEIAYGDYKVKAGTVLGKWSPVALDDDNYLVSAAQGKPAIGLVLGDLAPTTDIMVNIMIGGVFNPDRINWPATYTTDEQKRLAFQGAPTPTNIIVRTQETYAPKSNIS